MSAELLELPYGDELISFRLQRRERKTLSITVGPDLGVEVVAPFEASLDRVFEKVRQRAPWIRRQVTYFRQFHPRTPDRRYVAGESHLYLGRQYKLKVVPHIQEQVKLLRGAIVVQSLKPQRADVTQALLENWYRSRAHLKFPERLAFCRRLFPTPDEFRPSGLIVRHMKQRWGSMTPRGNLILNRRLIRASSSAIDYVITHELCHLRYPHHGSDFFGLLGRVMPDWEERKLKLEKQLA